MIMDVVIVTDSTKGNAREFTQNTIDSALNDDKARVCPIVVDTSGQQYPYENVFASMILNPDQFGYNKALNRGAELGIGQYIAFCNNDLLFSKNWASRMIEIMEREGIRSASGYCSHSHGGDYKIAKRPGVIFGSTTRELLAGWCFIWRRDLYNQVVKRFGGLDEDLIFWCCDNATTEQLNKMGERHGLITDVEITHVNGGSNSLKSLKDQFLKNKLTRGQIKIYNRKYGKNLFNLGV